MPQIKASDVKQLRDISGAGMMDCKKALAETSGDIDAAVDFLRKQGLSAASKKAGRVASEGMVLARAKGNVGVLIEVNSETDFVSKNDKFKLFVNDIAQIILERNPLDVEALQSLPFDGGQTVGEALSSLIATIGENMSIRRFVRAEVDDGIVASYVHGGGKIGVLVGIKATETDNMRSLTRDFAMHVAAANPQYISRQNVPEDAVARERAVLAERAAASGKPEQIIGRIVEGQIGKFYSEICLLEQSFVKDTDRTVGEVLADVQRDAEVVAMYRFQLGEGIERKDSDFAAEVAAQVHG